MQPRNPTTDHYTATPQAPYTDLTQYTPPTNADPITTIINHAATATTLPTADHEWAYHALIVDLWPTGHTITPQHFDEAITTYPNDDVFPNLLAYEQWVDEIRYHTTPRN